MLFANVEIIGQCIGPYHRQPVAMTLAHFACGDCALRGKLVFRRIRTIVGSTVADAVDRTELQVLDRFYLHINIGIQRSVLALVITVHHHHSIRITVIHVPVGTYRRVVIAVGIINGDNRRSRECAAQVVIPNVSGIHAARVFIDKAHVLTDCHQSVPHFVLRIGTEVIPLIIRNIRAADQTVLTGVTSRNGISGCFGTTRKGQAMAGCQSTIINGLVNPISVMYIAVGIVNRVE